jgi:hypothetical protein
LCFFHGPAEQGLHGHSEQYQRVSVGMVRMPLLGWLLLLLLLLLQQQLSKS